MELRHLRYFVAVAEDLHFTRAAARLYVTQSTLSTQIRQLEDEVGGPLFIRTSRAVELTESGRLLYAEARRVLDQADRAMHVARQSVLGEAGSIRIGFAGVAAYNGVLPVDLRAFRRGHPGVDVTLVELPPVAVVAELRSGGIDIGYTPDLDDALSAGLVRTPRRPIVLVAAMPDEHLLAEKDELTRANLASETLILPAGPQGDSLLADRVRPSSGGVPGPLRFVPSTLGVLTLAAAGIGIAIVPADLEAVPIPGLTYRPIADIVGPALIVVSRPQETLGPALAFVATLAGP